MSVMVRSASASQSGFFGAIPMPGFFKKASRTSLNIEPITEQIRDVLVETEQLRLDELFVSHPGGRASAYPVDEVAAVEYIRQLLRVTQDEVLAAVDVAERTFFGWKQLGRRPRKSSTGKLWTAVEVLFYLQEAHPNVAGWFNDAPEAREAFEAGDFAGLAALELEWAARTYGTAGSVEVRPAHVESRMSTEQVAGQRKPALRPVRVDATKFKGHTRRRDD